MFQGALGAGESICEALGGLNKELGLYFGGTGTNWITNCLLDLYVEAISAFFRAESGNSPRLCIFPEGTSTNGQG
eukprot:3049502-Amphidinium_carterae.1